MRIQTQTSKTLTITSAEIQAILIDHLQREGVVEEGDEITVENVPDVVTIQLVGKVKVLFENTTKLRGLVTCTETVETEDDMPSVEAKQDEPNHASNILSKPVTEVGDIDPNSIFADPIEQVSAFKVTKDIFSDPEELGVTHQSIKKDLWSDDGCQAAKKPPVKNPFA